MVLYHIARTKNIPSILSLGLIPGYRKGLTCMGDKWDYNFLTDNIEHIISTQLGIELFNDKYTVIKVDCTYLNVLTFESSGITMKHQFIVKNKIEPKYLKVLNQTKYKQSKNGITRIKK